MQLQKIRLFSSYSYSYCSPLVFAAIIKSFLLVSIPHYLPSRIFQISLCNIDPPVPNARRSGCFPLGFRSGANLIAPSAHFLLYSPDFHEPVDRHRFKILSRFSRLRPVVAHSQPGRVSFSKCLFSKVFNLLTVTLAPVPILHDRTRPHLSLRTVFVMFAPRRVLT